MGYTPNLDDKSSPYYWGMGGTYQPSKPKPKPERARSPFVPSSPLLSNDPELAGYGSTPGGNPERPSQPSGGKPVASLPSDYKQTELEAGQAAEAHRPGAGFTPAGRGEVRVNPNGVEQKGTNTGVKPMTLTQANALLSPGFAIQDPFSSNQLPTTGSSPYGNVGPVADGAEYGAMLEAQKPGAVQGVGPIADGEQYAANIEAGEQVALKPSDTEPTAVDPAEQQRLARRRAFLDGDKGSMQALRDAESTQGIVYAGGVHHIVNPNRGKEGENDFIAVDNKDDVRGYKSGRISAEEMKDKYVKGITEANSNPNSVQAEGGAAYNPKTVTEFAGPLADPEAYGVTLQQQSQNTGVSGIGPIADGQAYADNINKFKKSRTGR